MNKKDASLAQSGRISVSRRFIWYGVLWVLAAIAIQVFLEPEGPTETFLSEIQQRLRWPLYTPLMAVVGLVVAFPRSAATNSDWAAFAALTCFVVHAFVTLTRKSFRWFAIMIFIHAVLLAVAITFFIRFTRLPSGG